MAPVWDAKAGAAPASGAALRDVKARPVVDALERHARCEALAAAGRSCEIEELPAPSRVATALYRRWIDGELTADQVVPRLVEHHRCPT